MLEDRWTEHLALQCRSGELLSLFCIHTLRSFRAPMIVSISFSLMQVWYRTFVQLSMPVVRQAIANPFRQRGQRRPHYPPVMKRSTRHQCHEVIGDSSRPNPKLFKMRKSTNLQTKRPTIELLLPYPRDIQVHHSHPTYMGWTISKYPIQVFALWGALRCYLSCEFFPSFGLFFCLGVENLTPL